MTYTFKAHILLHDVVTSGINNATWAIYHRWVNPFEIDITLRCLEREEYIIAHDLNELTFVIGNSMEGHSERLCGIQCMFGEIRCIEHKNGENSFVRCLVVLVYSHLNLV